MEMPLMHRHATWLGRCHPSRLAHPQTLRVQPYISERIWSCRAEGQAPAAAAHHNAVATHVRRAIPADVHAMLKIATECDLHWDASSLREELRREWATVLVADVQDVIHGMLIAWLVADEVQILEVAVLPQRRRQGLASQLLSALLHPRNDQDGRQTAWLEVRASNAGAMALYEQLGFTQTAVRRGYYSDGEDASVMCKKLGPT